MIKGESRQSGLGRRLVISGLVVLLGASGCPLFRGDGMYEPPFPSGLRDVQLDTLKKRVMSNTVAFGSLVADCDVVIRSPLIRDVEQLELTGQLEMLKQMETLKPAKIRLELKYFGDTTAIRMRGDGENYKVQMPVFADSTPYGGRYGESVTMSPNRVHFLPEDVADALDLEDLFTGKGQVLRAYPAGWDLFQGSFETPPILDLATWHIDSVVTTELPHPAIRVVNSLTIDRRTEQILRLDKFRLWDGSLRTRIWYANHRPVKAGPNLNVEVPGEIMFWYPEPLEGTVIRMRLNRVKLNMEIPPERFALSE